MAYRAPAASPDGQTTADAWIIFVAYICLHKRESGKNPNEGKTLDYAREFGALYLMRRSVIACLRVNA